MKNAVTTGIRDALKTLLTPEGEEVTVTVYWVSAYDSNFIYDHERIFYDLEDAKALLDQVNSRCTGPDGRVYAERFNDRHWGRQDNLSLEARLQNELMWEVKEALSEGHRVPAHVASAAGL